VMSGTDHIDFKIQTEYDPLLVELGTNMKYVLCKDQGDIHESYKKQLGDLVNYDDLKQSVLDVLDGKMKPVSENH
jgi:hypothetical protein